MLGNNIYDKELGLQIDKHCSEEEPNEEPQTVPEMCKDCEYGIGAWCELGTPIGDTGLCCVNRGMTIEKMEYHIKELIICNLFIKD